MKNLLKYKDLWIDELKKMKWEFDLNIKWVAWIVMNSEWNLLLVLEEENKAWKKKWQWSIMMETVEEWETWCETLIRWIREEIEIDDLLSYQIIPQYTFVPFVVYDSKKNQLILVELEVFDVILNKEQIEKALKSKNFEISKTKLVWLEEFLTLKNLRPWNKEIFSWKEVSTVVKDWEYLNF